MVSETCCHSYLNISEREMGEGVRNLNERGKEVHHYIAYSRQKKGACIYERKGMMKRIGQVKITSYFNLQLVHVSNVTMLPLDSFPSHWMSKSKSFHIRQMSEVQCGNNVARKQNTGYGTYTDKGCTIIKSHGLFVAIGVTQQCYRVSLSLSLMPGSALLIALPLERRDTGSKEKLPVLVTEKGFKASFGQTHILVLGPIWSGNVCVCVFVCMNGVSVCEPLGACVFSGSEYV